MIVPTLLGWEGRALVVDQRADVEDMTRAWRETLGDVQTLNLEDRDTWTFRALSPNKSQAECAWLSEAITSELMGEIQDRAQELAFDVLVSSRPGTHLHQLVIEGSGDVARALREVLAPLSTPEARHVTSTPASVSAPHTLYVQGQVWKNEGLKLVSRLAAATMPSDTLHLLDDSEYFGFRGALGFAPRRVVCLQTPQYLAQPWLSHALEDYDTLVCFPLLQQRVPTCLSRYFDMEPEVFRSLAHERAVLVRCSSGEVFRARSLMPWKEETYMRRGMFVGDKNAG